MSSLGRTLMHEHLFVLDPEIRATYDDDWNEDDTVTTAVNRLEAAKSKGVDTVVDVTVIGLGRYIPRIQEVAARTSVNIIVATGLYSYGELPLYFRGPRFEGREHDRMTELFIEDIRGGIGHSGVRAAIIKCASDHLGLTPGLKKLFAAVAEAHKETGAPITTHTNEIDHPGSGLEQQEFLLAQGVDLRRVVIGHVDDRLDLPYLEDLMKNGSYIGMDHLHGTDSDESPPGADSDRPTLTQRVEAIAELCRRGHASQIVLSHDNFCFAEAYGDRHLDYSLISDLVVPRLLTLGVPQSQVDTMLIDNPREIFGGFDGPSVGEHEDSTDSLASSGSSSHGA